MVAMMAQSRNLPVVVCCETYKFAEGIRWDGVSKNELGEYLSRTMFLTPPETSMRAQRRPHFHHPQRWIVIRIV